MRSLIWGHNYNYDKFFVDEREHEEEDRQVVSRARKIQKFLSQPFHVAEVFTGLKGVYVQLEDTIKGFKGILDGLYDDLPEAAFYMVGTIEDAIAKAEKMKEND